MSPQRQNASWALLCACTGSTSGADCDGVKTDRHPAYPNKVASWVCIGCPHLRAAGGGCLGLGYLGKVEGFRC